MNNNYNWFHTYAHEINELFDYHLNGEPRATQLKHTQKNMDDIFYKIYTLLEKGQISTSKEDILQAAYKIINQKINYKIIHSYY